MLRLNNSNLRAALMLGAATASALSLAGAAKADTVETVVVTGSRIPQVGLTATSPVTSLGAKDIKLDGDNTIGNLLSTLPSVVNDGDGQTVNNGSVGISTIDLRNLGTKRTLVLVDGKRLVAADASLDVDTNQIPATMIDRIEVLTGGASAVYGSDAVAGVVNIILKKDFQGIEADSQASLTDHGDGLIHDSSMILGVSSDNGKGNITIYGEFMHRDPVSEANRDFSAHALAATNYTGCATPATHFGGFCFSGSGTITEGRVKSPALDTAIDPLTGLSLGPGGECATAKHPTRACTLMFTPNGDVTRFDGRAFNFAPFQQLQTQGQRYSFGATGHYQVDEQVDFYTRLTFSDNQVRTQIGPSPMTALFNINCGNPEMSDQVRQAIFGTTPGGTIAAQCATEDPSLVTGGNPIFDTRLVSLARRLIEVGPRIGVNEHSAFQLVGGIKGDLGEGWSYDFSGQYGHTFVSQILLNDALKGNFQNGLLVDPNTGLCIQDSANCSPMNFFTGNSGLTKANVNYIRSNLVVDSYINQWDMQLNVVGNLDEFGIRSPWAKDPIGVGLGAEYRQEDAAVRPDHNLQIGNLVGNNQIVATSGGFRVGEGYGEMRIPIIQDMEFARDLTFEGSGRFSSYDRAGSTWTWKAGLEWQVIDDIKFRVAQERSVRAPNVSELFTPAGGTSANPGKDPCSAAGNNTPTTAALCIATGVPAALVFSPALNCPTNQCQGAVGGNPFLKPEKSDSRTLGIVLTPTFIPGLTATVDWYDIKIAGFVTAIPIQTILVNCYSTAVNVAQSAANPFCTFIHRDALGTITTTNTGFVVQAEGNIAKNKTDGLDFEVNYDTDLGDWGMAGWGTFAANWIANWASFNELSVVGFSCVGLWGSQCGEPEPRFKSNLRLTWADADNEFSVSVKWRHLSGVQFELNQFGFVNTPVLQIPEFDYIDLSGTWAVTDGLELRGGVRNLFGKNPPVTDNNSAPASSINGNTFPGTYDALGRVIFIGATAKL